MGVGQGEDVPPLHQGSSLRRLWAPAGGVLLAALVLGGTAVAATPSPDPPPARCGSGSRADPARVQPSRRRLGRSRRHRAHRSPRGLRLWSRRESCEPRPRLSAAHPWLLRRRDAGQAAGGEAVEAEDCAGGDRQDAAGDLPRYLETDRCCRVSQPRSSFEPSRSTEACWRSAARCSRSPRWVERSSCSPADRR